MATDDQQVLVAGQATAPAHFTIPGNGQIQPKSVFAHYDGTSAAGNFQPALKVISDGGETVGIYPLNSPIAAGGSADVSWFPAVSVTAANAPFLPTLESTFLDSRVGVITASTVLKSGVSYLISAQGTYSLWDDPLGTGTPQPDALFPGPNRPFRSFTQVGIDPECAFAVKTGGGVPIGHITDFNISLDAVTWQYIPPFDGTHSTPAPDFFYFYQVVGQGHAPKWRINDISFTDNYGMIQIRIYGIPGGSGAVSVTDGVHTVNPATVFDFTSGATVTDAGSGTAQIAVAGGSGTVTSVASGDSSIVVTNPTTTPSLQLAALNTIATNEPPSANWSNNSHKITALTAGAAAGEAAIWDQTPAGIVTAKGDVIGGTGSHAASNLAVGSNGQVLTADSTKTTGLAWATAPAGASPLTTKGDVYGFDTANNRIGVGSNGQVLTADSSQSLGVKWSAAPSVGGYVSVGSQVLGADAASMTVGSIPGTYSHLEILFYTRTDESTIPKNVLVSFSGDTTSGNYVTEIATLSNAAAFTTDSTSGGVRVQTDPNGTSTANAFAHCRLIVVGYTAAIWKTANGTSTRYGSGAAGNIASNTIAGYWKSTAAITSVTVTPLNAVNLKTLSALYVYGIV